MGGSRLQEEDLRENDLVIELLELLEKILCHGESLTIVLRVDVAVKSVRNICNHDSQGNKLDLQALAKEDALLLPGPLDVFARDLHLEVTRRRWEEVDESTDYKVGISKRPCQ